MSAPPDKDQPEHEQHEPLDFERQPTAYRHWIVQIEPPVATVNLLVQPNGGLGNYALKLNSYDLAVDIELADIVQRLRFEHPEVRAVVVTSGLDKVFSAGANIQMLAGSSHHHKVNFCKFTNETRAAIEDATSNSGQVWLAAINGTAAGGGYELALACDEIILVDDRSSAVSLPEVPLLGVLPGTGGLTRLVDKRHVRRDLADVFCTRAEGIKGDQAVNWGLVDSVVPKSGFDEYVKQRALVRAATSDRPTAATAMTLPPLQPSIQADAVRYRFVDVSIDRQLAAATITITAPQTTDAAVWLLTSCRELDDAILRLRFNEPTVGTWVVRTRGDQADVRAADDIAASNQHQWDCREIRLYWARTLRRLELSARTIIALVEPESCFAGTLAELALAADRTYMLDTDDSNEGGEPTIFLSNANDGAYPMSNGLSRLESRFWGRPNELAAARQMIGTPFQAKEAKDLGLVTATPDDIDWDDEIRVVLEERASFSPDALTGMEANLRFAGPETMETKIFGRLTAWQNWIFQRPNATGPEGALRRYGAGSRPIYDRQRI